MKNLKSFSIAFALLGLMAGTVLIGWFGFAPIAKTVFSAGLAGFTVFCGCQMLLFVILGLAWYAVVPITYKGRAGVFIWGRMVRDAAASCLPFSQVGGFVLGARAVTLHGIPWSVAAISTMVDLTAEFVAEVIFAIAGVMIILARASDMSMSAPIAVSLGLTFLLGVAVVRFQPRIAPLFARATGKALGKWVGNAGERADFSEAEVMRMYGSSRKVAIGTAVHVLGWVGKGAGNWLAFRLLGADIDLPAGLAIEGILHVLLAPASMIPGYAGVQEAGYAWLGTLFGVSPELSLAVSLLRRARDLAVGIPILLIWQFIEMRRLRVMRAA